MRNWPAFVAVKVGLIDGRTTEARQDGCGLVCGACSCVYPWATLATVWYVTCFAVLEAHKAVRARFS